MHVDIVPVGDVPAGVKREGSTALRSIYDCEVTIHDSQQVPDSAYDSSRKQYRAEEFIELARRALRWLRDLHRGYAGTGHLPYRKD